MYRMRVVRLRTRLALFIVLAAVMCVSLMLLGAPPPLTIAMAIVWVALGVLSRPVGKSGVRQSGSGGDASQRRTVPDVTKVYRCVRCGGDRCHIDPLLARIVGADGKVRCNSIIALICVKCGARREVDDLGNPV